MATESTAQTPAAVALFQKAHNRIVTLQRLDEQMASLLDQRKKLQEELRQVQQAINEEFEKVIRTADDSASRMMSTIASDAPQAPTQQPPQLQPLTGGIRVGRIELVSSDAA